MRFIEVKDARTNGMVLIGLHQVSTVTWHHGEFDIPPGIAMIRLVDPKDYRGVILAKATYVDVVDGIRAAASAESGGVATVPVTEF